MSVNYHVIGPGIRIHFDNEDEFLIISKYKTFILGFYSHWENVAMFTKEKQWKESEFPGMVSDEYWKDAIMLFWFNVDIDPY